MCLGNPAFFHFDGQRIRTALVSRKHHFYRMCADRHTFQRIGRCHPLIQMVKVNACSAWLRTHCDVSLLGDERILLTTTDKKEGPSNKYQHKKSDRNRVYLLHASLSAKPYQKGVTSISTEICYVNVELSPYTGSIQNLQFPPSSVKYFLMSHRHGLSHVGETWPQECDSTPWFVLR